MLVVLRDVISVVAGAGKSTIRIYFGQLGCHRALLVVQRFSSESPLRIVQFVKHLLAQNRFFRGFQAFRV